MFRTLAIKGLPVFGLLIVLLLTSPTAIADAAQGTAEPHHSAGTLLATLADPRATSHDFFGSIVAVSGNTAVIGAPGTRGSSGEVYIYEEGKDGWPRQPTTSLADPDSTVDDGFGVSVADFERTVVVGAWGTHQGAGAAYVYVKGASIWPTAPTVTLSNPSSAPTVPTLTVGRPIYT